VTSPEDDPAGFQALRAAYERALAYAAPAKRAPETRTVPEVAEPRDSTAWTRTPEVEAEASDAETPSGDRLLQRHAWRAPEGRADRGGPPVRTRAWRPPAATPIAVGFDEATEREYAARRKALAELLAGADASTDALRAALRAVLASPVLEQMGRHNEAEVWVAQLIARNTPRADPLIDPAIEHFGWDDGRVGPSSNVGVRVLARRDDVRFLVQSQAVGSPFQGALAALARPPARWRLAANRLTPDLGRKVRAFLAAVRAQRPGVIPALDPQAVAWWDNHLDRPRLGALEVWSLVVAPAMLALIDWLGGQGPGARPAHPLGAFVTAAGLIGSFVLVRLYVVAWPRELWRRRWAARAPDWVRFGWAAGLVAVLPLSALAPPSDIGSLVLAAAAALLAIWAVAVGDPDRRQVGQSPPPFRWRGPIISFPIAFSVYLAYWWFFRPGVRFPWTVRALFAFFYLGVFWLLAAPALPSGAFDQMTVPLAAAALAFVVGAGTLSEAWERRLGKRARRNALFGLASLAILALATLWLARDEADLRPAAATLIAIAVLLHKTPAADLFGAGATLRDLVMRFGGVALMLLLVRHDEPPIDFIPYFLVLVIGGPGLALVAIRALVRAKKDQRRPMLARAGGAVVRYGWIVAAPILLQLGWTPTDALFLAGGLWMLTGVGVTLAALIPSTGARPT
jgi:hypothetical protein